MVNCFAADCDHTSESHHCRYFGFPRENRRVQNMGFDAQKLLPFVCVAHTAAIRVRHSQKP